MDLYAYSQIDDLDRIAKANGIDIPRLRGYRLMKDEEVMSPEELKELLKNCEIDTAEDLCTSVPFWDLNASAFTSCSQTDAIKKYYLIYDKKLKRYVDIRWDRIHGQKRRILKFAIKQGKRSIKRQFETWNKYVGRDDVLYIHSRMGGYNWKYYEKKGEITNQPWFLERVDDAWDCTYCDFYAKIDLTKEEESQSEA